MSALQLTVLCVDGRRLEEAAHMVAGLAQPDSALVVVVDTSRVLADSVWRFLAEKVGKPVELVRRSATIGAGRIQVVVGAARLDRETQTVLATNEAAPFDGLFASLRDWPETRRLLLTDIGTGYRPPEPDLMHMISDLPVLLAEFDHNLRFLRHGGARMVEAPGSYDGQSVVDIAPDYHWLIPVYRRVLAGEPVNLNCVPFDDRYLDLHYRPVQRPGQPPGMLAFGYDVTEREVARRRLQQAADILAALPLAVLTLRQIAPGPLGFIVDQVLTEQREHLPLDASMEGARVHTLFPEWPESKVPDAAMQVLVTKKNARVEARYAPQDEGDLRHLRLHLSALGDDLLVVTAEDISEVMRARKQHLRIERREAIGQIAGRVAHDINGLLASILHNVDLARRVPPAPPELSAIAEATDRAADMVARLLAFSRRGPVRPKVTTVHALVQRELAMFRSLLGRGVRLYVRLAEDPWSVQVDPSALELALLSLLDNARAAQPEGGRVTLEVDNQPGTPDQVRIQVRDEGHGMDEATRARCFDPGFSKDGGTGLGLPAVAAILEQAGGSVELTSSPGAGTTVSLLLPRVVPDEPSVRISIPMTLIETGVPRVLVVDDEDLLRHVLVRQLRRKGYEVASASSGPEAIKLIDDGLEIDLLICDVVMPGMNGLTVVKRLRGRQPELRVILTTGYTDHASIQANPWAEDLPVLFKPFEPAALYAMLKSVLRP